MLESAQTSVITNCSLGREELRASASASVGSVLPRRRRAESVGSTVVLAGLSGRIDPLLTKG